MGTLLNRRRYMGGGAKVVKQYLRFVALEDGTFKHNLDSFQYSLDEGNTWTTLAANTDTPTILAGQSILWKGNMSPGNRNQWFVSSNKFDVEGDPRSLIYGDNFENGNALQYLFYNLFRDCTKLVHAHKILLPLTTLAGNAYMRMFQGCSSLESCPSELPTTSLSGNCYGYMFSGCSSLINAPEIFATTLSGNCCQYMFYNCSSLVKAPSNLYATILTNNCYQYMFEGCTSLTKTPIMSPSTIANSCCYRMFYGCKSITDSNVSLPATTIYDSCYLRMFQNCNELVTAPVLPALTLAYRCYFHMFDGCTNLNYIKAMFTDASASGCLDTWVNGVASSGTFVKNSQSTFNTRGASGIPNNWTIETADS